LLDKWCAIDLKPTAGRDTVMFKESTGGQQYMHKYACNRGKKEKHEAQKLNVRINVLSST